LHGDVESFFCGGFCGGADVVDGGACGDDDREDVACVSLTLICDGARENVCDASFPMLAEGNSIGLLNHLLHLQAQQVQRHRLRSRQMALDYLPLLRSSGPPAVESQCPIPPSLFVCHMERCCRSHHTPLLGRLR